MPGVFRLLLILTLFSLSLWLPLTLTFAAEDESLPDFYRLLGVAPTASVAEIREAYQAATWRAETSGERVSDDIRGAYELLTDLEFRQWYDNDRSRKHVPTVLSAIDKQYGLWKEGKPHFAGYAKMAEQEWNPDRNAYNGWNMLAVAHQQMRQETILRAIASRIPILLRERPTPAQLSVLRTAFDLHQEEHHRFSDKLKPTVAYALGQLLRFERDSLVNDATGYTLLFSRFCELPNGDRADERPSRVFAHQPGTLEDRKEWIEVYRSRFQGDANDLLGVALRRTSQYAARDAFLGHIPLNVGWAFLEALTVDEKRRWIEDNVRATVLSGKDPMTEYSERSSFSTLLKSLIHDAPDMQEELTRHAGTRGWIRYHAGRIDPCTRLLHVLALASLEQL